jgi:hypothetical protein
VDPALERRRVWNYGRDRERGPLGVSDRPFDEPSADPREPYGTAIGAEAEPLDRDPLAARDERLERAGDVIDRGGWRATGLASAAANARRDEYDSDRDCESTDDRCSRE